MSEGHRALQRRIQNSVNPGHAFDAQVGDRAAARPASALPAPSYPAWDGAGMTVRRRVVLGTADHGFGAEFA